jgi:hypothetical protein
VAAKLSNCAVISATACRRARGLNAIAAPSEAMSERKQPSAPTSLDTCDARNAGRPSTSTRCSPTRSRGMRRARATASAAADPDTMRLAAVKIPRRWAVSTASLTSGAAPKSSAVTIKRFKRHPSRPGPPSRRGPHRSCRRATEPAASRSPRSKAPSSRGRGAAAATADVPEDAASRARSDEA